MRCCCVRGPAAARGRRRSCVEETAVARNRQTNWQKTKIFSLISLQKWEREKPRKRINHVTCATAIPFVHTITCVRIWVTLGIRLPYSCQRTKIYNRRKTWTNRARGYTLHYKDTPVRLREYMTGLQIIGVWKLLDFLPERRSFRFS